MDRVVLARMFLFQRMPGLRNSRPFWMLERNLSLLTAMRKTKWKKVNLHGEKTCQVSFIRVLTPRRQNVSSGKVFTWEKLNYHVPVPGGQRRLLHDVYGYVKPGSLTALMGASGAGG